MAEESLFEGRLKRYCDAQEWECLKLRIDGENGFPDRTILGPDGNVFFAELKAKNGTLRGRQKWWLRRLQELGYNADVFYSYDDILKALDLWQKSLSLF